MIIDIDDELRIETTQTPEFTLQRKRVITNKKSKRYGEVYWKNLGHFGRIDQALERAADHVVAGSDQQVNLNELSSMLKAHFSKIRSAIKRIKDSK